MNLSKRGGNHLDRRQGFGHLLHHREEGRWVELPARLDIGTGQPQPHLQVLLIADQHVDMFDDPSHRFLRGLQSSGDLPEFGPEVEIERDDGAGRLGRLHPLDDHLGRRGRQRREDSPAVKPADTTGGDRGPVEVTRSQQCRRLVGTVVEDDRGPDTGPLVTVNGGHVRAADTVVLEHLVERANPHGPDTFVDQVSHRRVDHRGRNPRGEPETVREIGRAVEFATADMDLQTAGLAKGNRTGVEAMDHRAEGQEIDFTGTGNLEHEMLTSGHRCDRAPTETGRHLAPAQTGDDHFGGTPIWTTATKRIMIGNEQSQYKRPARGTNR